MQVATYTRACFRLPKEIVLFEKAAAGLRHRRRLFVYALNTDPIQKVYKIVGPTG
jgi:hypothetical protein